AYRAHTHTHTHTHSPAPALDVVLSMSLHSSEERPEVEPVTPLVIGVASGPCSKPPQHQGPTHTHTHTPTPHTHTHTHTHTPSLSNTHNALSPISPVSQQLH